MAPITDQCLDFSSALAFSDLPEQTVEQMKKYVFDLIGCGLGGSATPGASTLLSYVRGMESAPRVSVFGYRERHAPELAAMFNAAACHALEMDDSDRAGYSHPGVMVIPPAMAVAEWRRCSGKALLTACVAGYEVMLRIGAAAGPEHYSVWHTTATTGVFGAAVSAGKMLELDRMALGNAFGNAGTLASGLWQFNQSGAMSKVLHAGRGVANGLLAACLAEKGFTGAKNILEGSQGFFAGCTPGLVKSDLFDDFGKVWRSNGVSFKPYPCCRHTHSAIDCALAIRSEMADRAADIASINVKTYEAAMRVAGGGGPITAGGAKFSLPYCVAAALLYGPPMEEHFHEPFFGRDALTRLTGLVGMEVCRDLEAKHPFHEGSMLTVTLRDGSIFEATIEDPLGDPERPLSWEDLENKFTTLTDGLLSPGTVTRIMDTVRSLEDVDDWSTFVPLLRVDCRG